MIRLCRFNRFVVLTLSHSCLDEYRSAITESGHRDEILGNIVTEQSCHHSNDEFLNCRKSCITCTGNEANCMDLRDLFWVFKCLLYTLRDLLIRLNSACVSKAWGVNYHEGRVSRSLLNEILRHFCCDGLSMVFTSLIYDRVPKVVFSLNTKAVCDQSV